MIVLIGFLVFFFPSVKLQGYPKQGKPSMVTSSSSALVERGPTNVYRLLDWEQKQPWSARYDSGVKYIAAISCGCAVSICVVCSFAAQQEYVCVSFEKLDTFARPI